jgi:uncharacterized membrane protein
MSDNAVGVWVMIFVVILGLALGVDGGEINGNH